MLLIVCFIVKVLAQYSVLEIYKRGYYRMNEQELRDLFSLTIKRFRNRRSWSQAKLAEKLGMSTNFISDIETKKGWVSPLTLVKLAAALDVEVYELFKPENSISGDFKDVINKLTKDLTVVITDSVELTRKQYTESA